MKKTALSLAFALGLVFNLQAQKFYDWSKKDSTNEYGSYGITFGLAIPTSDFASTDKTSQSAGRAKTGYNSTVFFNYQFGKKKRHGLIIQLQTQTFDLNNSAYNGRLANGFGGYVKNASSKGEYSMSHIGLGHNMNWKLNEKHSLGFKYILSYMSFKTPGYEATFANGDKFTNSEGSGGRLGFTLAVNYRLNISKKMFIMAELSSNSHTLNYDTQAQYTGTSVTTLSNSLSTSNVNLAVGFGFRFYKNK